MLLTLARSALGRHLVGWLFAHMSFAIPVKRLRETETLLAFHHPRPVHRVHILLIPKKALASPAALTPADTPFLADLFATVGSLVEEFELASTGYRLVTNGGRYQDVPQLHFHLIGD